MGALGARALSCAPRGPGAGAGADLGRGEDTREQAGPASLRPGERHRRHPSRNDAQERMLGEEQRRCSQEGGGSEQRSWGGSPEQCPCPPGEGSGAVPAERCREQGQWGHGNAERR